MILKHAAKRLTQTRVKACQVLMFDEYVANGRSQRQVRFRHRLSLHDGTASAQQPL